ncbi:hypothetical protein AB3X52_03705 [Nocardioides sp. DS6]|uniref:DUF8017 domain-containing protein n=1 Tax=Nocardioides eburneus TaxID=3231482 RepID=A0ABV3SUV1_9ACTN
MAALRSFAWVLGIVAALAVVGTSAAAVVLRDPDPLVLRGAGVRATVPDEDWRIAPPDYTIEYAAGVGVLGPAVYREDWCAAAAHSSRAFAGFVDREGRTARQIAQRWGVAITRDRIDGSSVGPVTVVASGPGRADADLRVPTGPCNPPREHLTVVADGDQALILVRDIDVEGALPTSKAEAVLASLRCASCEE